MPALVALGITKTFSQCHQVLAALKQFQGQQTEIIESTTCTSDISVLDKAGEYAQVVQHILVGADGVL
jgi:hypothetical protein